MTGFRDGELYGTVDFRPGACNSIAALSTGRSQQVPGSTRIATLADTNIPRPGYSGLPQAWAMLVYGWRVAVITPKRVRESDALAAWLATTVATFYYNGKPYATDPLSELVRLMPLPDDCEPIKYDADGPNRVMTGQRFVLPVHLQESLTYSVRIEPQDSLSTSALSITLAYAGVDLSLRVFLTGLIKDGGLQ